MVGAVFTRTLHRQRLSFGTSSSIHLNGLVFIVEGTLSNDQKM